MALGPAQSGRAIEQSADKLLRFYRLARAGMRRDVFPGLLDGIMGAFLARCGQLMGSGGKPEDVWPGLVGIVRWAPALGAQEATAEWAVTMEVLAAACELLQVEPQVAEWLARALAEAERGTAALRDAHPRPPRPEGVVTLFAFGDLRPRNRGPGGAD